MRATMAWNQQFAVATPKKVFLAEDGPGFAIRLARDGQIDNLEGHWPPQWVSSAHIETPRAGIGSVLELF